MTVKDTAPTAIRKLAEDCLMSEALSAYLDGRACAACNAMEQLCRCPVPDEWIDALAGEIDAAISDRQGKWVETLIAGRPYDTPLVEWEAREGPYVDCPLCGKPSDDGYVHQDCAEYEAARADMIPAEDAPEAAANQDRW